MRLLPLLLAGLLAVVAASHFAADPEIVTDTLPATRISYPSGQAKGVVVLFSGREGWSEGEDRVVQSLNRDGAVVVGIDLPDYYAALAEQQGDCLYLVSEIEDLTRQLHRHAHIAEYHPPLVAGIGDGATLALAIAAQTPNSTIAGTVAVDPGAVIPLSTVLCTPAPKTPATGGTIYGLTAGELPNPVQIVFSSAAGAEGRRHADELKQSHADIELSDMDGDADSALQQSLTLAFRNLAHSSSPLDLPVIPLEAKPSRNLMAIVYSGDGGWRDIDQKLGGYLQGQGIPVVGVDALRYFWNEKTPDETAADLSRIIATYRKRWKVDHVLLIGYSFGANILPATYRLLPETDRQAVSLLSLLALSHQADFQVDVTGWLGFASDGKYGDPIDDLREIEGFKIQCIHGDAEDDSACPDVRDIAGAQVLARKGGHHFDGDYRALSRLIVERADALLASH
ncbi:virulence factor family protein [Neorhizobium lilium]|uniref:Virulence factor family protein n=1 Tax=Neorhizobium lilium TaxID=2503024 RepID=A0A3S3VLQ1_9HYPH|nr:AcvB/VirJ family lysyl-phosphatidylglycerol hydrolase [Neorhizobium lilium]RWX77279.1 virulence factor family protein [Neorhizobium lilium]